MDAIAPAFLARLRWLWIVLGILGVSYMALCPHQYHKTYMDFLAGLLAGLGVAAVFVRTAGR
ncbi:MAG: hypothetical protein JO199_06955 [Candidatus Eremiobacteraeota bacterium]|nr:hypothetical protein [Candidatus Eremiobacteraeota bacterium]